jgi:hypothetical protein
MQPARPRPAGNDEASMTRPQIRSTGVAAGVLTLGLLVAPSIRSQSAASQTEEA